MKLGIAKMSIERFYDNLLTLNPDITILDSFIDMDENGKPEVVFIVEDPSLQEMEDDEDEEIQFVDLKTSTVNENG